MSNVAQSVISILQRFVAPWGRINIMCHSLERYHVRLMLTVGLYDHGCGFANMPTLQCYNFPIKMLIRTIRYASNVTAMNTCL